MKTLSQQFKRNDIERKPGATPTRPDAEHCALSEAELEQVVGGGGRVGGGGDIDPPPSKPKPKPH